MHILQTVIGVFLFLIGLTIFIINGLIVRYMSTATTDKKKYGDTNTQDIPIVNCFYANCLPATIFTAAGLLFFFTGGLIKPSEHEFQMETLKNFLAYGFLIFGFYIFVTGLITYSYINNMTFMKTNDCNVNNKTGRTDDLCGSEDSFNDEVSYKKQLAIGLWIMGLILFIIGGIITYIIRKKKQAEEEKEKESKRQARYTKKKQEILAAIPQAKVVEESINSLQNILTGLREDKKYAEEEGNEDGAKQIDNTIKVTEIDLKNKKTVLDNFIQKQLLVPEGILRAKDLSRELESQISALNPGVLYTPGRSSIEPSSSSTISSASSSSVPVAIGLTGQSTPTLNRPISQPPTRPPPIIAHSTATTVPAPAAPTRAPLTSFFTRTD